VIQTFGIIQQITFISAGGVFQIDLPEKFRLFFEMDKRFALKTLSRVQSFNRSQVAVCIRQVLFP
jgi:hypothetical protein